jgi:hypothetical protein
MPRLRTVVVVRPSVVGHSVRPGARAQLLYPASIAAERRNYRECGGPDLIDASGRLSCRGAARDKFNTAKAQVEACRGQRA